MKNIWNQFSCQVWGDVGCGWSTLEPTLPDWLITFIILIPMFGIGLWLYWSFIMGKPSKRPRWVNIYALIGVVYFISSFYW